jgi:hypothetical protein
MGSDGRERTQWMSRAGLVAGILLIVVGGVWIFQGVGLLKGSFMTGEGFWAWMGAVCVLLGLPLLLRGLRRSR